MQLNMADTLINSTTIHLYLPNTTDAGSTIVPHLSAHFRVPQLTNEWHTIDIHINTTSATMYLDCQFVSQELLDESVTEDVVFQPGFIFYLGRSQNNTNLYLVNELCNFFI